MALCVYNPDRIHPGATCGGKTPPPNRKPLNIVAMICLLAQDADGADGQMIGPLDVLRIIAGLILLFFLPGYTLVVALFPRRGELDKEYDGLYKFILGMGMSVVIVILTGFGLNSLGVYKTPEGEYMGYVQTPYLLAAFLGETLFFFIVGWWRGGWPFMARIHPKLRRTPKTEPGMIEMPPGGEKHLEALEKLGRIRERLKKEIKDYERRERLGTDKMREHYKRKLEDAQKELKVVNEEIEKVEKRISTELY